MVKKYYGFRILGLIIIGFIILKTYSFDVWQSDMIVRILAFIFLGLFVIGLGLYYSKIKENIKDFIK